MDQDFVNGLAALPPLDGHEVCFAARRSGLYRSEDGGLHWRQVDSPSGPDGHGAATCVTLSPEFEADPTIFVGAEGGVLKSADGGQDWKFIPLPPPASLVTAVCVSPNFGQDGFAIASTLEDGVFRSVDRGESWNAWNINLLDHHVLCMAISPGFSEDETIFIGTETGLFTSTNRGRSWQAVNLLPVEDPMRSVRVLSLAVSPNIAGQHIWLAGTESQGLWLLAEENQSWRRLGRKAVRRPVNGIVLSPFYPTQPDLLVVHGTALLYSRDRGESWSAWPGKRLEQARIAFALAPQGLNPDLSLLLGLTDGNVIRSTCSKPSRVGVIV